MKINKISNGVVHVVPLDLKNELLKDKNLIEKWNNLTALGRNEWICWTISVKKSETRKSHIERLVLQVKEGKKRPCCWAGCVHRDVRKK